MPVLQIEHAITDFETWKRAFDSDPVDRKAAGVRRYRIFRPVDDPAFIKVDLEFDTVADAESCRAALESLWASGRAAPALAGRASTRIVETIEAVEL
jgi:hypothetical protein